MVFLRILLLPYLKYLWQSSRLPEARLSIIQPANYMFNVNNRNTRTRCEICSKLTVKIPEQLLMFLLFLFYSNVSIVDFEQVNAGWVWALAHSYLVPGKKRKHAKASNYVAANIIHYYHNLVPQIPVNFYILEFHFRQQIH